MAATHTWVGDLVFTVTHSSGEAVIYDQPGVPASTFGCSGDNVDATINDEGVDGDVETTCLVNPAIAGDLVGGDPPDNTLLSTQFDGLDWTGDWVLNVSDNVGGDSGTLTEWCLVISGDAGGDPPIIEVDPTSLSSTLLQNDSETQVLDISNVGGEDLEWFIEEDNVPVPPLAMPAYVAGTHAASAGMAPSEKADGSPAVTPVALGSNAYSWNSQNGPYYTVFDIDVPDTLPNIAAFPAGGNFVGAGEYYNGLVYMMDVANNMYEVDPVTGAINNQYAVTAPPGAQTYSGMAIDPTTGIVYASSTDIATSSLFTIDPPTGVATLIGPITGSPGNIAISFDGNGDLYGYDIVTDSMYFIDKTNGNAVNLGLLPFDANFGQGMGYDPATDTVYLAAFNNGTFLAELYTYDPGTNSYTFMGVLGSLVPGGLNQLSWLGFQFGAPPEPCSPEGEAADIPWLSVNPTNGVTLPGDTTPVDVTFDSTGLNPGFYQGALCVFSNDPQTPLVIVPVDLTVEEAGGEPDPLVCNAPAVAFENGIPTDWTVVVNTGPVYWSTTDDLAACDNGGNQTLGSGEAACADSDQTNIGGDPYDTELWTNSFDLSGYNAVSLEFAGTTTTSPPAAGTCSRCGCGTAVAGPWKRHGTRTSTRSYRWTCRPTAACRTWR